VWTLPNRRTSIDFRSIKPLELLLGLLLFEVLAALVVTGVRIVVLGNSSSLVDDAYISLRYADNAARGLGLVWNAGGPPVDGFTSLFHVVILTAVEWAGGSALAAAPLVGVLGGAACTILTFLALGALNAGRAVENLMGAALLGLSPHLWFWSKAGLETTLFASLLLASVMAYLRQKRGNFPAWATGLLFALCALTRPEGALLFGATLAFDLAAARRDGYRLRGTLQMLAGFSVLYVPVFLWQWAYFGQPLPNTYYAKTGALWLQIKGGWEYLLASLPDVLARSSLPLLGVFLVLRKPLGQAVYVLYMALAGLLVIVLEGGDPFPWARFVVPLLPLMFILGTLGLSELTRRMGPGSRTLFLAVLFVAAAIGFNPDSSLAVLPRGHSLPQANSSHFKYMDDPLPGFIAMGNALRASAAPGQTIATVPIGAIGYFSGMRVLDMVGLTDSHIAHESLDIKYAASWYPGHDKGDGLYVLAQRPDYIQLVYRLTSQPLPGIDEVGREFKSAAELWAAPEFHELYEFAPLRVEGGWYFNLYRLRTEG